ncbi:MAG TPA: hypothetical protein VLK33_01865, partial [Terriglobales bacterium]|nr:hypothetical protein [Terriglobales bacterium]
MRKFFLFSISLGLFIPFLLSAQNSSKRPIAIDDIYRMEKIGSPQISPDGKWVAYTVTSIDKAADRRRTSLWMVNWEGTEDVRLTFGKQSASSPQWSPDGKYLSFLSFEEKGKTQVWLLDRRGGAPQPLTNIKEDIDDFTWSPDGKKILLAMSVDEDPNVAEKKNDDAAKAPKPIVLDRYHFKHDVGGYLTAASRTHLYLFDVETKKLDTLTSDKNFEDSSAEWSPDGKQIAFISNHEKDPDQSANDEIYVMDAHAGATPRKLASFFSGAGQRLSWSPDGK